MALLAATQAAKPDILFLPLRCKVASLANQAQRLVIQSLLLGGDGSPAGAAPTSPARSRVKDPRIMRIERQNMVLQDRIAADDS
jgi:hypothetical protein